MQQKFLQVRLHQQTETRQGFESTPIGIYKVDLYTLAIGPIHHSISLTDRVSASSSHPPRTAST